MNISFLCRLIRPILFALEPEVAHHYMLSGLRSVHALGLKPAPTIPPNPRTVMGLTFPNPVGLAAGLDKDGICIDGLASLGFGFLEIGTVTPQPQAGNARPRLFRLPAAHALINRMGFNNSGLEQVLANIQRAQCKVILGINLGKNAITPMERAIDDYRIGLRAVYRYASYVTINISSPNTKNLRQLQGASELGGLLAALKSVQTQLADQHGRYVPLALKIAPDLDDAQIKMIADTLLHHRFDGVIATNTTMSRQGVQGLAHSTEAGGLSGAPVLPASNHVIRTLKKELGTTIPIIGVGGICSAADAVEKITAGASLVQLYTGLIYRGPALISECAQALSQH